MKELTTEQVAHDLAIAVVTAQLINRKNDPSIYSEAYALYEQARINLDAIVPTNSR